MSRSFARLSLLLLVPALAACDGTEVDPPPTDALVGTWLLTDLTTAAFVTPARDVVYPLLEEPGAGDLALRMDTTGATQVIALPYLIAVEGPFGEGAQGITLRSFPAQGPYPNTPWAELRLSASPHGWSVLSIGRGTYVTASHYLNSPTFTLSSSGLTVDSFRVEGYDPTSYRPIAYVGGGSLAFVTRSLAGGAETEVEPWNRRTLDYSSEQRIVFEADGTYRNETTVGNRTTALSGRWVASDGRVSVRLEEPTWNGSQGVTIDYAYRSDGDDLILAAEVDPCPTWCIESVAASMRLPGDALRSVRSEARYRYTPSETRWLPPAEPDVTTTAEARARLLPGTEAAPAR